MCEYPKKKFSVNTAFSQENIVWSKTRGKTSQNPYHLLVNRQGNYRLLDNVATQLCGLPHSTNVIGLPLFVRDNETNSSLPNCVVHR